MSGADIPSLREKLMDLNKSTPLRMVLAAAAILLALAPASLAQHQAATVPQSDTSMVDANGTAHITRVVPIPGTISPQAQAYLLHYGPSAPEPTLAARRAHLDAFRASRSTEARKLFPVHVKSAIIGGIRCDIITPVHLPASKRDRILINVHGGGFNGDSGSLVEGIPVAYLTQTTVVGVYYRLAPEHPFPAAVDDTIAVYKALLKTHTPKNMALFGTSAGAILTAEAAVEMKREHLPLPAALGVFSGTGDFSQPGDTRAIFALYGFRGSLQPPTRTTQDPSYVGHTNPKDPVLSPVYADLHGMPPTLFISGTRDMLLSGTATLDRAFLRAGNTTQFIVFEAMPHAFWYNYDLPESREALGDMAAFFDRYVGR